MTLTRRGWLGLLAGPLGAQDTIRKNCKMGKPFTLDGETFVIGICQDDGPGTQDLPNPHPIASSARVYRNGECPVCGMKAPKFKPNEHGKTVVQVFINIEGQDHEFVDHVSRTIRCGKCSAMFGMEAE